MFFTVNLQQDKSKLSSYLSNTLLDKIDETLEKGEKVLLYINKRGSYSSLICEDCQHLFECPNCDTSLSVHSNPEHLRCHICNNAYNIPKNCPKCSKNNLKSIGVGTQQIESLLKGYYKDKSLKASPKPSLLNSSNTSLNSQNTTSDTSLNLSCQERNSYNNNVVGNYYETPDYIKVLVKELRIKQTKSENILWEVLRAKRFNNLKFRRQHPFGRYIADFYCDNLKLVLELDGEIHEKTKEYDKIRDEIISQYGVYVLRINNSELENISGVLEKIAASSLLAGENGERCLVNKRELEGYVLLEQTPINIYRFDSDAMKNISSKREALGELDKADIIIGTKMITTGFDFANIGLIGVLLIEGELSYPSYDAEEKAYSNLKQLIGRGNRKSQETQIILQTFIPKNPLVKRLTDNNFKDFFATTLQERKDFLYPPYREMVTLEYRHKDSKKTLAFTEKLEKTLKEHDSKNTYQILRGGSTFKKNNSHHATLIVKGENIREILKNIEKTILRESGLSVIFH